MHGMQHWASLIQSHHDWNRLSRNESQTCLDFFQGFHDFQDIIFQDIYVTKEI